MFVFSLFVILGLLGSESKVHLFQSMWFLFQKILHTRVKPHLARFHMVRCILLAKGYRWANLYDWMIVGTAFMFVVIFTTNK